MPGSVPTLFQQSQPPPEPGNAPEAGIKRSLSDRETASPDPKIKEEPDVKKQKLDEITAPVQQSFKITEIDPAGDLLIVFDNSNTAFKIDSNTLKRASPKLYQKCLAVRPADGSTWTAKGLPNVFEGAVEVILNLIHANMDKIPVSMSCATLYNVIVFTKRFEMLDRFSGSLKQWYKGLPQNCCHSSKKAKCKIPRLWMTCRLGLEEEFKAFQAWAIFNLCDDGKGALGDPRGQLGRKPLELSNFSLSEEVVTGKLQRSMRALIECCKLTISVFFFFFLDRIIRLRSEAVNLIMTKLKEVQLAMIPPAGLAEKTHLKIKFDGNGCSKCLDLWLGCLCKSLLKPDTLGAAIGHDFPSLLPLIEAKEYHQTLEQLCTFIDSVQDKMNGYFACQNLRTGRGQWACCPPQLVGRNAVEDLVSRGLKTSLGAT